LLKEGLYESPGLDGKREPSSTTEIAKDVAAMANDGGVLIYGVDEDAAGRLSLGPELDHLPGQAERIANAVANLVHNPPAIHPIMLTSEADSSKGRLVVLVPQSPLAPHMAEGRREGRYYGRIGTTTVRLSGEQVAQLMARQAAARMGVASRLDAATRFHSQPEDGADESGKGQWTLLIAPTVSSGDLVRRAAGDQPPMEYLQSRLRDDTLRGAQASLLNARWLDMRAGTDSYRGRQEGEVGWNSPSNIEVEFGRDGTSIFRGRGLATVTNQEGVRDRTGAWFNESSAFGSILHAINLAGQLYRDADWVGYVDLGLKLDDLRGAASETLRQARSTVGSIFINLHELEDDTYTRFERCTSEALAATPGAIARRLFADLVEALTQGGYPQRLTYTPDMIFDGD
jgi:hypothetical protein